jgi:hypothetical protein
MTFADSLRAYADWCEEHPDLVLDADISTYGSSADQIHDILFCDSAASVDMLNPEDKICYIKQRFGSLSISHVVRKEKICNLAIVDNQVTQVLKPEFAELVKDVTA